MSFEEFLAATALPDLPKLQGAGSETTKDQRGGAAAALAALWHDAQGDWDRAHACVQDDSSREGAWVHAYLHRREGDDANARYWYARANRKPPTPEVTLDAERRAIGRELLEGAAPKSK